MAFWVVGGGNPLIDAAAVSSSSMPASSPSHVAAAAYIEQQHQQQQQQQQRGASGKRRVVYPDATATATACSDAGCYGLTKRPRLDDWGRVVVGYHGHHSACEYDYDYPGVDTPLGHSGSASASAPMDRRDSIHVKNLAFFVIRERKPSPPPTTPTPPPPPMSPDPRIGLPPPPPPPPGTAGGLGSAPLGPAAMERTQSGLSISSDTSTVNSPCDQDGDSLLSDLAAARLVRRHVANIRHRRHRDSQHGRILKALINPKSRGADFPLDNDALRSIFSAANELFFANKLSQRVTWDWSHPASAQYQSHIVGTTALRRSARLGGYETLIVLSSPILKDTKYNRRLLISTFLHEMIHSFLFITCGFKARQCGGHTQGFRQIAEIIDEWVGKDYLRLRDMEADLERFIDDDDTPIPTNTNAAAPIDDVMPHINNYNNNANHNGGGSPAWAVSEWRHPETHDYPTIRAPQPYKGYSNPGEWEWHDREGFRARGVHHTQHTTGSPYHF